MFSHHCDIVKSRCTEGGVLEKTLSTTERRALMF